MTLNGHGIEKKIFMSLYHNCNRFMTTENFFFFLPNKICLPTHLLDTVSISVSSMVTSYDEQDK